LSGINGVPVAGGNGGPCSGAGLQVGDVPDVKGRHVVGSPWEPPSAQNLRSIITL